MNQQWGSQEAVFDKTYMICSQKSASLNIDPASSQPFFIQMNLKFSPLIIFTLKFTRKNQEIVQAYTNTLQMYHCGKKYKW